MLTRAERRRELLGLCLLALALFLVLALIPPGALGAAGGRLFVSGNLMGVLGAAARDAGVRLLGAGCPVLPIILALLGSACFGWFRWETAFRWSGLATAAAVLLPAFLALFTPGLAVPRLAVVSPVAAGWIGQTIALPLVALLNGLGAG